MTYTEGQTGHLALHGSIDQSLVTHAAGIAAGDVTNPASAAGISLSATIDAATPPRDRLVVNRAGTMPGNGTTLNRIGTSKAAFRTGLSPVADLEFAYGGWGQTVNDPNSGDVAQANAAPLPIQAAIEYPSGVLTTIYFRGSATGYVENGGTLLSDTLGVDIPADTRFWVRTWHNPATGDRVLQTRNTSGGTHGEGYTDVSNLTTPGSVAVPQNDAYVYAPYRINGRMLVGVPSVALVGDSITRGIGDTSPFDGSNDTSGYAARAVGAAKFPWIVLAVAGERGQDFLSSPIGHLRRMPLTRGCSSALVNYGTNDLQAALSPTFASMTAMLVSVWRLFHVRGIATWGCTLTPNSTTTDAWATVANQAISADRSNSVRVAVNNWMRDGAPIDATTFLAVAVGAAGLRIGQGGHPLRGYFETADAAESARDSGLWKASHTSDGLHPNATGHAALAAAVDTSVFV